LFTVYIDNLDLEVLRRMPSVWMVKFIDDTKGGKDYVPRAQKKKTNALQVPPPR
jgi:hypothetical protein